jgi:hypothetical protein
MGGLPFRGHPPFAFEKSSLSDQYRPDLNPDEYLNQDVKSNAVGRRRPADAETMRKDISGYLRGRQRRPQIVMNYFKHESVPYAS